MSRKTAPLIKRAATMFVAGQTTENIITTLSIRPSTLTRWQTLPLYQQQVDQLKQQMQQRLSVRLIHLLGECMEGTQSLLQADKHEGYFYTNRFDVLFDMLKAVGKERFFPESPTGNAAKKAPNTPKTAPKRPQNQPHMAPENTPKDPQYADIATV